MAGDLLRKKFQIEINIHFALVVAQNIIKRSFATFCFTAEHYCEILDCNISKILNTF